MCTILQALHKLLLPLFITTPCERYCYHPIPQGRKLRLRDGYWPKATQLDQLAELGLEPRSVWLQNSPLSQKEH